MFSSITESLPYLVYLAPPLIGALIGYLTNRVAIRMLFRPLNAWYVGRLKVPMTPGVIPSKRDQLAANIGEMVGEHLLTSDEVSRSLQREAFQDHLRVLIESTVASVMKKELGALRTIVPPAYQTYFDIAVKTASYQIKEGLHDYLRSDEVAQTLTRAMERWCEKFLACRIDDLLPHDSSGALAEKIVESLAGVVPSPETEAGLADTIAGRLRTYVGSGKSCADILPEQTRQAIIEAVRAQTPRLLKQAAGLLEDPEIKKRLVDAVILAIEEFVETLGPMSSMVKGFLKKELLEPKVTEYLVDHQHDIAMFLQDHSIEIRVRAALGERLDAVLTAPLSELILINQNGELEVLSKLLAANIVSLLNSPETLQALVQLVENHLARMSRDGEATIGEVIQQILGAELSDKYLARIKESVMTALYSAETNRFIDHLIDELVNRLVDKPIGRLDHLIPQGVAEGVCNSLRTIITRLLISEVPGILKSLNIRKIVTDRIDSFDLLRLEQLLLSIMAEQFKYINLFGALLGFVIGCANLIFILGTG